MRLTDSQRLEVEYNKGKYDGKREVAETIGECTAISDCFQEDHSIAYRVGDIVMTKAFWQTKLKEWELTP